MLWQSFQAEVSDQGEQQRPFDDREIAQTEQQTALGDAEAQAGQADATAPTVGSGRAQEDFIG